MLGSAFQLCWHWGITYMWPLCMFCMEENLHMKEFMTKLAPLILMTDQQCDFQWPKQHMLLCLTH